MRVVRYERHGGPEVLQVHEVDEPSPGPGELSIATEVVAGSWVDTLMRSGTGPFGPGALPGSPHGEVVGTVRAVGEGVDPGLVGTRVAGFALADAYADVVVVDAAWTTVVPEGVSAADGSALAMAAQCALIGLEQGGLAAGETVLVHTAAGSIGHLTVQLARLLGAATVIGVVGSAAKKDFVRGLGADEVVVLGDADWTEQVRAVAPDGVDLAIDSVGGEVSGATLELTRTFGRMVVYGAVGGTMPVIPAYSVMGAMRTVTGFGLGQFRDARPAAARRQLALLAGYLATGQLHVEVAGTVSLDDAPKAHELLEDRSRVGRVLVRP